VQNTFFTRVASNYILIPLQVVEKTGKSKNFKQETKWQETLALRPSLTRLKAPPWTLISQAHRTSTKELSLPL
jgi:hypothetical protein